jgi:hypothetical protein
MSETARERAEQSVSSRFTRVMNATTSRWGVLTDPSMVGLATAPAAVGLLAAVRLEATPGLVMGLELLAAVPVTVAVLVGLSLTRARGRVVEWLATLPFPVENLNAVLNGLGESLEVSFQGRGPDVKELNAALDQVSPESFVFKGGEAQAPGVARDPAEPHVFEVRIGVVDSTRNPSASNHQRFRRVQAIVHEVLIPLAERHPIVEVRVK